MKEGISNIWLIGIIILFITIFASYIAVTINYTAAFKLKNEALSIVEKHKGMTDSVGHECTNDNDCSKVEKGHKIIIEVGAIQTINLYLKGRAYTSKGYCPNDGHHWYGVPELAWDKTGYGLYVDADQNTKYYWCFARYTNDRLTGYNTEYYKIRLFYKLEFPALSEFLSIKVEGLTDEIYDPQVPNNKYTPNTSIYS